MARLAFRDSPGVLKLYTSNWRDGEPVTLKIDTGQYDAMLGRSYAQIGREGYRMHRSQGMSARNAAALCALRGPVSAARPSLCAIEPSN